MFPLVPDVAQVILYSILFPELVAREKRPDPEPAKGCDSPRIETRPPSGSSHTSSRRASPSNRLRPEDSTAQRRKRLRRQPLQSHDRASSTASHQSSVASSDYHVLAEGPVQVKAAALGQTPPKPVRAASQPQTRSPPMSAHHLHHMPPHAASVDFAGPIPGHSPRRQGSYESRVILSSGQPPPGDVTLRRPRSRHKLKNDVDVEKLLSNTHSIRGKLLIRTFVFCSHDISFTFKMTFNFQNHGSTQYFVHYIWLTFYVCTYKMMLL